MALASTIDTLGFFRRKDIALIGLRAPYMEALRTAQTTGSTEDRRIAGSARGDSSEELSNQQAKRRTQTGRPTVGREATAADAREKTRKAILASGTTALKLELGRRSKGSASETQVEDGIVIVKEEEKQKRKREQREPTYIYTTTSIENQLQ